MSIVGNQLTEINDVVIIKADTPLMGIIVMIGYTDDVIGETPDRYFSKRFRYTIDGINYTEWQTLNNGNIALMDVSPYIPLIIEYEYRRSGTDATGILQFNSVTVEGEFIEVPCPPTFSRSVFAEYFTCTDAEKMKWCLNVLSKVYKRGIVPDYIERGKNNNINGEDADYISLFRAISCYFSNFVRFARLFGDITGTPALAVKLLDEKGMKVCEDLDPEEFLYLLSNYYSEVRKRGTRMIAVRKSDGNSIDGEILRTLCTEDSDEILLSLGSYNNNGWIVGRSSPLYRGTYFDSMLIKAYEQTKDFDDLSKYPKVNEDYISITDEVSPVDASAIKVMDIVDCPIGQVSGIGQSGYYYSGFGAVVVAPNVDYEITFWVKSPDIDPSYGKIWFGVKAYDESFGFVNMRRCTANIDNPSGSFFLNEGGDAISLLKSDRWYHVRGIVYGYHKEDLSADDATLNIGFGENMRMKSNVRYIVPQLYLDNTNGGANSRLKIWDFKIRPLNKPYSLGFIRNQNVVQMWLKNNNGRFRQMDTELLGEHPITGDKLVAFPELEEFIRYYLIPYNSNMIINWLNE